MIGWRDRLRRRWTTYLDLGLSMNKAYYLIVGFALGCVLAMGLVVGLELWDAHSAAGVFRGPYG